jgi:hypothetical protein
MPWTAGHRTDSAATQPFPCDNFGRARLTKTTGYWGAIDMLADYFTDYDNPDGGTFFAVEFESLVSWAAKEGRLTVTGIRREKRRKKIPRAEWKDLEIDPLGSCYHGSKYQEEYAEAYAKPKEHFDNEDENRIWKDLRFQTAQLLDCIPLFRKMLGLPPLPAGAEVPKVHPDVAAGAQQSARPRGKKEVVFKWLDDHASEYGTERGEPTKMIVDCATAVGMSIDTAKAYRAVWLKTQKGNW